MSNKNFMSYGDAETLFTEVGRKISEAVSASGGGAIFRITDPSGDCEGATVKLTHGSTIVTGTISSGSCIISITEVGAIKVEIGSDIVRYVTIPYFKDVNISTRTVYGFRKAKAVSNPAKRVEYLNDAVGYTPAGMDYSNDVFDYGDWENAFFMPRPCMLRTNGEVAYYLDPDDYTKKEDGTASDIADSSFDGDVMIEFPKIWVYRYEDQNYTYCYIADHKVDNNYKCYANMDAEGNEIDRFYVAAYDGSIVSNKLRSLSGVAPANTIAGTTFIADALAKNTGSDYTKNGWYISQWCDRALINDLLVLIGKSTDTQTVFGKGHNSGGSSAASLIASGTLNAKGMFYGKNVDGYAVKVFGIENYFGNLWKWCAGLMATGANLYAKMTWGTQDGSAGVGYGTTAVSTSKNLGKAASGTSGGYISNTYNSEFGDVPITASGSSDTYECDGLWFTSSGVLYALVGGACSAGLRVGAFALGVADAVSVSSWGIGAALSCKPPNAA
jgi:hypothetical protein